MVAVAELFNKSLTSLKTGSRPT